jgi:hypothetical protein
LLTVDVEGRRLDVDSPVPVRIETWSGEVVERPSGRCRVNLDTGESE